MILEGPLTHRQRVGIIKSLERAARPSGCSEPGTLTRQSLVPGFFIRLLTDSHLFSDLIFYNPSHFSLFEI